MDESQRIKLQEMIDINHTLNHTEEIRTLKHMIYQKKTKCKIDVN